VCGRRTREKEASPNSLPGSTLEEDVIGHNDCRPAAYLEHVSYVLEEVELFVRCGGPEVLSVVGQGFSFCFSLAVEDGYRALLAEWRVSEDQVHVVARFGPEAVVQHLLDLDRLDAVKVEVHHAEPGHAFHDVGSKEGLVPQIVFLVAVEVKVKVMAVGDVVVDSKEEAAGPAGWIAYDHARQGAHHFHHRLNQWTRGEVLASSALDVLGVLLEEALVDLAFDVNVHPHSDLAVD